MNEFASNECDPSDAPVQAEDPTPPQSVTSAPDRFRFWADAAAEYAKDASLDTERGQEAARQFFRCAQHARWAAQDGGLL